MMPMQWQWWNTSHSYKCLFLHYPWEYLHPHQSPATLRYRQGWLQTPLSRRQIYWQMLSSSYVHDSKPECRPSTLPLQITDQPLPLHFVISKSLTNLKIAKKCCPCSRDTTNPIVSLPLIGNDFEYATRSRQHPIADTLTAAMEPYYFEIIS